MPYPCGEESGFEYTPGPHTYVTPQFETEKVDNLDLRPSCFWIDSLNDIYEDLLKKKEKK